MLGLGCILQLELLSTGGGFLHGQTGSDHYRAKRPSEIWKPPINRLKGTLKKLASVDRRRVSVVCFSSAQKKGIVLGESNRQD